MMSFFKRGGTALERITGHIAEMVADARHSFEAATEAVLSPTDLAATAQDIHATDDRINRAEQSLRRELIIHVSVQGGADIGMVLGWSLLVKKVERIGDQAKNILDLALEGVNLADAVDREEYVTARDVIAEMFDEVAELIAHPDRGRAERFKTRADVVRAGHEQRLRDLVHSDEPGHWAVPRAVLHRYLKRIVANLEGVALTITDPDRELPDEVD